MSYKRIVVTEFGGPPVLDIVEEDSLPEPQPGEVRVRVVATSAAFTDTMIRKGMYPGVNEEPPFTPGYDMVGVVDELGQGVTEFRVGQRVAALTVTGAYSEYMCLPNAGLVPVPDELDPVEAVSLVLSYVTAYQMLHREADLQEGQRILVHGAGGAVGTALLQLGSLLALDMYGTASPPKQELVAALGAVPIDYTSEDFTERILEETGEGVDAVFDPIGGENFRRSFQALRPGGTLVAYGFYSSVMGEGGSVPLDFLRLRLWDMLPNGRSTTFYSIEELHRKQPDWFYDDLTHLFTLLAEEKLEPVVAEQMPLTEAARAHQLVEEAAVEGKLVLVTAEDS